MKTARKFRVCWCLLVLALIRLPVHRGDSFEDRAQGQEGTRVAGKDAFGDSLPPWALARMGTLRWRLANGTWFATFSPDGKAILSVDSLGQARWFTTLDGAEAQRLELLPLVRERATELRESAVLDTRPVLSPDGQRFAGLDILGDLHLWECGNGDRVRKFATGLAYAYIAFAPDGKDIIGHGMSVRDQTMDLVQVNLANGDVQRRRLDKLDENQEPPMAGPVCLRDDGKILFVRFDPILKDRRPTYKAVLFRTDLKGDKEPARLLEVDTEARRLLFSPDGRLALLEGALKLVDTDTGRVIHDLSTKQEAMPLCIFSADSKLLIGMAGDNQRLSIWDTATGKKLRDFSQPIDNNAAFSFLGPLGVSADNKTLICDGPQALHLIDLTTGKELHKRVGHQARITDLCFTADGKSLLTQAQDMTARVWEVAGGRQVGLPFRAPRQRECFFLVSPDLKTLVAAEPDGTLRFLDPKTNEQRLSVQDDAKGAPMRALFIAPDSQVLGVVAGAGKTVRLYNLPHGKLLRRLNVPQSEEREDELVAPSQALVFSPRAELTAAVATGAHVIVWDTKTGKERQRLPIAGDVDVRQAAFAPDLKTLAVDHFDGRIILWDLTTGKAQGELGTKGKARALSQGTPRLRRAAEYFPTVAFSPDGRLLARTGDDSKVHLWSIAERKLAGAFQGHTDAVVSLAFAPDGTRLATSSLDGTVLVWDVAGLIEASTQR